MAKDYLIPFDSLTGDLIEWMDPDIVSGRRPIPVKPFDILTNRFVTKPWFSDSIHGERTDTNPHYVRYQTELNVYNGRILSGRYQEKATIEMRPNTVFGDYLRYKGYSRGRSSAKIDFISETSGCSYSMFLTDFDTLMERTGMNALNGHGVYASFTFVKRGQNYGVRLVDSTSSKV